MKMIAIIGMVLQHAALALPDAFPLGVEIFLQISGGLTFPIMAFLLVEGFRTTSNISKYKQRIAIFGAISFVPHLFALGSGLNIMFTLLFGLMLLEYHARSGKTGTFWGMAVLLTLISTVFDWGIIGPIVILLYGAMKNEKLRRALVPAFFAVGVIVSGALFSAVLSVFNLDMTGYEASPAMMFFPIGALPAIPLLLMYKGERGRKSKWFFYIFYPAHLVVLAVISLVMGNNVLVSTIQEMLAKF